MIKATFYIKSNSAVGFEIKGHSGYEEEGKDIICASVSSAAYMAANTVTDVIGEKADIKLSDGYFKFMAEGGKNETKIVLKGLQNHVNALADDYSEFIICKEKAL